MYDYIQNLFQLQQLKPGYFVTKRVPVPTHGKTFQIFQNIF